MTAGFLKVTLWNTQLIVPNSAFDGPSVSSDKGLSDKVLNWYTAVADILLTLNPVYGNSISKTNVQKTRMSQKFSKFHSVTTEMIQWHTS